MPIDPDDLGVFTALLIRFERQRLPRVLHIQDRVLQGELLSDLDIYLLDEAFDSAQELLYFLDEFPDYEKLIARAISLYKDVTDVALENEKNYSKDRYFP